MKSIKDQMREAVADIRTALEAIDQLPAGDGQSAIELAELLNYANDAAKRLENLLG